MLLNETNIDFQVSKAMEARQVEQRCVILMTKNSPFDVVRILAQGNIILDPYCLVQSFSGLRINIHIVSQGEIVNIYMSLVVQFNQTVNSNIYVIL